MADLAQLGIVINVSDQNAAQKLTDLSTAANNATSSLDKLENASKKAASAIGNVGGKRATDNLNETKKATEKAHDSWLKFLGDINKLDREFAEIGKTQTGLKELQKNLNAIGTAATAAYNDGALVTKGFNDVGNASAKLALKIKEQKVALEALNSGYYDAQQTAAKDAAAKAEQLKMVALHTQALKENKEITERWATAARENAALITQESKERKAASDAIKQGILEREKERDIMGADNRRATILEINNEVASRKALLTALKDDIIERDKQTKKEQENITALNKFKEKQIALQKETALSYATADKEAQKYHETMGFLREAFDKIITRVGQFAAFLAAAAVVQAFTQAIKGAISVIIDFDQSLKSLEAIAGATATQASVMGDTIKQIAADTKFSAQEVAAGMETIGKAGFTAGESLAMIQDVANLATGAMEDLDKVSSLVITAINAFGMEVVQTAEITDIFANALIGSKLDVEDLVVAFNYVGAAGAQAGLSLNEVSGTLMVLSDNGLRASTMGTGLRKTLLSMLSPNKSLRAALDSVGMAYDDINTNIVGYEQALKNIAPLVWDFTNNTVDMSKAQAFFGTTASQVAAILIRETAQGGGISTAIKSTEEYGSALAMAQKQQEGLGVKTKNLQDHLKNVALAVGEAGLTQALHKVVDALKLTISVLEYVLKNYPVTQFAGYAAAATAIAAAIYGIYNALEALVTSSAFKMLFGGLFTTPLGQVTLAILGVATALTALYSRVKDAPKEFEKLTIEIDKQIANIESWRKVLAKASEEGLDAYESQIVKFISSNKELSKQILKSINERREAGEELYTSFEDLLLSAGSVKEAYKRIDEAMQLQKDDKAAKQIETMASAAQLSALHFSNLEIKIAGTRKQLDEFYNTTDSKPSLSINGITDGQIIKVLDKFKTDLDGTKKILQQYGKDIAKLVMDRAELTNQTKEWGIALIKGLEESLGGEGVKAALEQFGILWDLQLKKAEEDALNAIPEIVGAKWLGVLSDTIHDMESKLPMLKIADYEKGKAELIKNLDDMREIIIKSDLFKASGVSVNELNIAIQGLLEQGLIDLVKGFDGVKKSTDDAKSSTEKLQEKIVELKEELSGADLSFATESGKLSTPLAETLKIFKEAGGSFGEFSDIILKLASDTDGLNLALEDLTMEGQKISFGGDLETVYNLTLALEAYKQKLEVYKYAIEVQKEVRSEEEKFREEVGKVNEAMEVVGLSVEDATKKVELLSKTMADSDVSANSLSNAIKAAGVQAGLTEVELTDLIIKIRELNTEAKIDKNLEKIHEYQSKLVEKNAEAYDEMYEKAYDFTRDVIDDFDSMGDTLVDLAENMVKDIAAAFLTQTIVMPVYMYAANELGMSSLISGASGVSTTGSSAGATVSGAYNAYSAYGSLTGGTADAIAKVLGSEIGSAVGEYIFGAEAWGGYNTIGSLANLPGEAAYEVAANAGGAGTTYSTGMVNSLSAASAAGIISSLAYTYLGEMLGLPQGEYSGLGAGIGGAAGYTVGASLASGAASGASSGSWAGPVGAIIGAIVGGVGAALLGEDTPDYRIGLFPGNFDWEGSDRMATSENYGYSIATQDYSVKNVESLFSFYDDVFQALDEATTASINDIVAGAQTGDYGRISWFDPSEMSTEDILEGMTTDLFRAIREGLVEDIGAGFDADVFTFDFFESIQAEGENLLDTYLGFREAAETLGTGEFLEQFNYQVDTLNVSAAQAYENMKVIAETVYSMTETANALSSTANMTTFEDTVDSWKVLIETLEQVKATSEQLTEAELARNEVLGSQVTGLTATTIEGQLSNGGDLNELVSTQINAIATSSIAETIYAEYIESLNEEAGRIFAESDYDINVLIEYLQGIDTTDAQNKIEELQESFGLLAESADTAEAMRIVTLALEGQLTAAQKFEEWQIENIEAMNLFSEMVTDGVTADELGSAVDAFAALGIEGDDLSNVIQDLANNFTETTEQTTEAAEQLSENMSAIESLIVDPSEYLIKLDMTDLEASIYDVTQEAANLQAELEALGATEADLGIVSEWLSAKTNELTSASETAAAEAAAEAAAAIETERLSLEQALLELQGDTVALRALELQELDESNYALQEQIWALEDATTQQEALTAALEETTAQQQTLASGWISVNDALGKSFDSDLFIQSIFGESRDLGINWDVETEGELQQAADTLEDLLLQGEVTNSEYSSLLDQLISLFTSAQENLEQIEENTSSTGQMDFISAINDAAYEFKVGAGELSEGILGLFENAEIPYFSDEEGTLADLALDEIYNAAYSELSSNVAGEFRDAFNAVFLDNQEVTEAFKNLSSTQLERLPDVDYFSTDEWGSTSDMTDYQLDNYNFGEALQAAGLENIAESLNLLFNSISNIDDFDSLLFDPISELETEVYNADWARLVHSMVTTVFESFEAGDVEGFSDAGTAMSEYIPYLEALGINTDSVLSMMIDRLNGETTDDTADQIADIFATIQEGIDTLNLSEFETEIYNINKQAQDWTDSLAELGVTASEDLAIIDEWVTAQRNALAEGISEEWQNIINENTLSDTDLQLIELDAWYADQLASATELGLSLDTLTQAYDLQKESIEEARQAEIDSLLESASDYLSKSGLSEFESQMLDLEKEADSLIEQLTELGATDTELTTITEWLSLRESELADAREEEIDSLLSSANDYFEKLGLSEYESQMLDLEKEAESLTDQLTELGATSNELAVVSEWLAATEQDLIDARQDEVDSLLESASDYLSKSGLSEFESQMLDLNNEADSLTNQLIELNATNEELAVVTEWLSLKEQELLDARQAEIKSLLSSANDYLSKSGLSEFESQMLDLNNEAESLTQQLTELNATNEELAIITEWLSVKEQELIDARQAEIDAFNKSIQDIISKNTLSDLEYELANLTSWYDEQKASAEGLGVALDAVNEAYELQKKAAYESAIITARSSYIESLQAEQSALEDALSIAKENYINGLNDEITALNETASEAEKTADSFESLLETINALQYSSVTDSELNPDTQMAFVGAELAAAMAKIQSGDTAEIQAGMEDLPNLTSDFLELSKQTSGSFSDYQNDFAYVMRILNEAEQIAVDQKSTAELSLDELTAQTESLEATLNAVNDVAEILGTIEELEAAYNAAKSTLDNSWYQDEIDRLTEINNSVLSLTEAQSNYFSLLTAAITAGFSGYQSEYAATISPPASTSPSIALKAEYGFATGGTVTGPDSGYFLPTTFHGTEHITPDSEMTEVKEVLGEVKDILISIRDTGGNVNKLTIQTNRLLDRVTQGGTEMRVKEIA